MIVVAVEKIREDSKIPERATEGAIGFDVYASRVLDKWTKEVSGDLPAEIKPGGSILIGIGVRLDIPFPYEAQVRPRSGLASRYDIELSNSPGTIDPDFRGEAGVLLRNRGEKSFVVEKDMRIAQLIFTRAEIPELKEVKTTSKTIRGEGGFGSTGLFEIKK
ncbi:MAG: dUTP diphosphatase [Candidatus Nealsonbacteria bacterium]